MQKREFLKLAGTALMGGVVGGMTTRGNDRIETVTSESVYERVMRTGKIRSGYMPWAPFYIKDPNTGEVSGIFPELAKAACQRLGIEIEFTEEVAPGNYVEAIQAGRIDVLAQAWVDPVRGKFADASTTIYYIPICAYVRQNETRFVGSFNEMNDKSVRLSIIDGEMGSIIANQAFTKAAQVALPIFSDSGQMLTNVVNGKADVAFTDVSTAERFIKKNPDTLKIAFQGRPVRVIPNANFWMPKGDVRLKTTLDAACQDMLLSGEVEAILKKYEEFNGSFLRLASPYQASA